VISAGRFHERELPNAETEPAEIERTRQSRATRAVGWILVIANPLRIVQHGEKDDDDRVTAGRPRGEVEADRRNMSPVLLAVEHRHERGR